MISQKGIKFKLFLIITKIGYNLITWQTKYKYKNLKINKILMELVILNIVVETTLWTDNVKMCFVIKSINFMFCNITDQQRNLSRICKIFWTTSELLTTSRTTSSRKISEDDLWQKTNRITTFYKISNPNTHPTAKKQ